MDRALAFGQRGDSGGVDTGGGGLDRRHAGQRSGGPGARTGG
jgi:hypothetical protein